MEPTTEEGPQFSISLSDWLLCSMSYMMINLAQVSPPRQQVRIDGIQEDDPSSWACSTLSEFGKSVPNQGPTVLGGAHSAVWECVTGNQWQALKVSVLLENSLSSDR